MNGQSRGALVIIVGKSRKFTRPPNDVTVRVTIAPDLPEWRRLLIGAKHSAPSYWVREKTQRWRVLPNLVILGAQRCGTTSLFRDLAAHPAIMRSWVKEVDYFSRSRDRGIGWYQSHFPLAISRWVVQVSARRRPAVIEASPSYLFDPHAPANARTAIPDAKLVVLLRNPTDRALSHYHHQVRRGREPLSFAESIEREWRLIETGSSENSGKSVPTYLARGRYAEQLKRWMACYPTEQFLIIRSEDYFAAPEKMLAQVLAFAGIGGRPRLASRKRQASHAYEAMDETMRRTLDDYFRPHNRSLYDLLHQDFAW